MIKNKFSLFLATFLFIGLIALLFTSAQSLAQDKIDPDPPSMDSVGIDLTGGPDAFGYVFTDSTEPDGPDFSFIDISATGTPVPAILGDDLGSGPLPIGFNFNFYGTIFTQFFAASNGYISFDNSDLTDFSNDCPIPNPNTANNSIYPLWDDLCLNGQVPDFLCGALTLPSGAFFETFNSCPNPSGGDGPCTIFMWQNAAFLNDQTSQFDFEVILYDNGNILTQYGPGNPQEGLASTTGIENLGGTDALLYACNAGDTITDGLAICFIHPDSPKQDCMPMQNVVTTPIPTMSEWGLIAMAGILGIVGFMVIRRRKVTA